MTHSPKDMSALVEQPWIVWSNEHRAFWGPNHCGYTGIIQRAGRYSRAEAETICRHADPRANSTIYKGQPPEICMPAPEAIEFMAAEIAALQAKVEEARGVAEKIGAFVRTYFEPWGSWKTAWWEGEVSDDDEFSDSNALKHVANIASAALSPATPKE